ncbi:methyl-accepting chemotaxis protein [Calidifontibacillus oryziterrae]|uniref:methyl-accepting chemotaxis protein n=1 Tax=Calidifontibacillus oryziterrae TaxID=1191699 RepID=UPI00031F5929|nr:methyl-accepting chemotaxis protein [Calidifontibacillus oryziterrae]
MRSLRVKILGSFTIILTIVMAYMVYNFIQTNNFKTKVEQVLGDELRELVLWQNLSYDFASRLAYLRAYVVSEGVESNKEEFDRLTEEIHQIKEELLTLGISEEQMDVFKKNEQSEQTTTRFFELFHVDREAAMAIAGDPLERQRNNEMVAASREAANQSEVVMVELREQVTETGNTIMLITVLISIISIAIGILIAVMLSNRITNPIVEVVNRVKKVASGDLTGEKIVIKAKDEIGQLAKSMNEMVLSLRELIGDVLENANNLAASSEEISASTEQIATGSQQQANNAGLASEMVKEMVNAIQAVSVNAEQTSDSSKEMVTSAEKGNEVIKETLSGMTEISNKISELSSKSMQIGEIIEVIDDIAEQTNLLALNAAIEAARAGEAGKGFAVVADEVRKLAERSSKATKEISELIQSIQENTDASVEAVESGNEKAINAGHAFEEIINLVKVSASKVAEIAAASEEQNAQSQEVLQAVESIAAVSEETAAGVQETAATAQDLAKMAESLSQLAAKFNI